MSDRRRPGRHEQAWRRARHSPSPRPVEPAWTDECPEHGTQNVKGERASRGPDPYAIVTLACGHEVMNFGDGNVIV